MNRQGTVFALVLIAGCSSSSPPDKALDGGPKDTGAPDTNQRFQCAGAPANGCSAAQLGLVCVVDPGDDMARAGVAIDCECLPTDGGQAWQCGISSPCPGVPPQSGTECPAEQIASLAAIGGCKYPIRTLCSCQATGGGEVWNCADAP